MVGLNSSFELKGDKEVKDLERKFRVWQKDNYNFMTPRIEKLWIEDNLIAELSSGTPFLGLAVRGVTFYRFEDGDFIPVKKGELNKGFTDENWRIAETKAIEYLEKTLRELLI